MSKIMVLPETIANKIAAGEVIERPASVVKELVENSIDAGASQVVVEIKDAGKKLIRVVDNGSGMSKEDAKVSFERHATSKIKSADDLFSIHTLGFRGEALPSIAAVSKLELVTRTGDSLSGTKIEIGGGKIVRISDSGSPVGTSMTIHDLFYNTPARLKFLKTDYTELSQISDAVTHLALAYPKVSFRLVVDGKENFYASAVSEERDRVVSVLGKDTEKELLSLAAEVPDIKIRGYVGRPSFTRKNWFSFLVFVNGRFVNNRTVNNAVYEGYHGFLMVGRYPVGAIFLEMNPKDVDVNVHPAKREVRFQNEKRIQEAVSNAVRDTLRKIQLIPEIKENSSSAAVRQLQINPSEPGTLSPTLPSVSSSGFKRADFGRQVANALKEKQGILPTNIPEVPVITKQTIPAIESGQRKSAEKRHRRLSCAAEMTESTEDFINPSLSSTEFPELIPLAQLDETYILCRGGDDLLIVDQHAAHERVLFDKLFPKMESSRPVVQQLLIPVNVELTGRESAILKEYLEDVQSMGMEVDSLGGNTFTIRAIPQLVERADYREILLDLLDTFSNLNTRLPTDQLRYQMAAVMSCRAAIKAGDPQNPREWQTLIKRLQEAEHPYTCPHGRPTVIRLSKSELEKRFKRTGA